MHRLPSSQKYKLKKKKIFFKATSKLLSYFLKVRNYLSLKLRLILKRLNQSSGNALVELHAKTAATESINITALRIPWQPSG